MSSFPSGKFYDFLNTQQKEIQFSIGNLPTQLTWIIIPSIAVLFGRFFSRLPRRLTQRLLKSFQNCFRQVFTIAPGHLQQVDIRPLFDFPDKSFPF